MRRINFAADLVGDVSRTGVQAIIHKVKEQGDLSPEGFVDTCLDLMGPLEVDQDTRQELVDHVKEGGTLSWGTERESASSSQRIAELLQLIVSVRDYQYA